MISAEQAEDRPIPRPVETSDQDAERKPRSDMQTWIRQRELEARSVYLGEQRRLKALDKAEEKNRTSFGAGVGIVRRNLPKLAGALEAFVRKQKEQSGPNHTAVKWIEEAGAELAALVTLRVVVNHLPDARPTPDVLEEIAERLRADLNFDRAKAEGLPVSEKGGFQEASKRAREKLKKAGVDLSDLRFTRGERLHLGGALLHVLIETTGLVRQEQHTYEHNKRPTYVVPEDSTLRELEAYRNNGLRWRWPKYAPMVVRPRRWSQGNGGYRFDLDGEVQLLRRSDTEQGDLSRVRRSLDRIQETPWEINEPVLALAREVARRGGDRMGLRSLVEAKPAIPSTEWSPPDDEPYIPPFHDPPREWREKKARWSAATRVEQTLAVAEEMAGDTFWLPHNLDWRGRIYPVPDWLNPQGDDLARGMLRFADGKPLGEEGGFWLALHGANCLGKTPDGDTLARQSLDDREAWISERTAKIEAAAADPLASELVRIADEPFQFYAFALEWSAFTAAQRGGRGAAYVSHLPCGQDGTCNGLQHLAALWRDEEGGRAVNLLPSERPNDFYVNVRHAVLERLESQADEGDEQAKAWLWNEGALLTRKLIKRPAMTFGYGATRNGFTSQVANYIRDEVVGAEFVVGVDVWGACRFLAGVIWKSMEEDTAKVAFAGREWLQGTARAIAKTGRPVAWTVPLTGLRVVQDGSDYWITKLRRIKTLSGSFVDKESTGKVDTRKQVNSIAPNVVHSLDAAALMLTVELAARDGVTSWGVVHDSYHVLAADAPALARAARQAFMRLHEEPILEDLHAQFSEQAGDEIPTPPKKGTLDIRRVLEAKYFLI